MEIRDGIVCCQSEEIHIDFAYVNACMLRRLELVENNNYPLFIDITKVKSINIEARTRLMKPDGLKGLKAVAVYVENNVQCVICRFIMMNYNPGIPLKVFKNRLKAFEWVKTFSLNPQIE